MLYIVIAHFQFEWSVCSCVYFNKTYFVRFSLWFYLNYHPAAFLYTINNSFQIQLNISMTSLSIETIWLVFPFSNMNRCQNWDKANFRCHLFVCPRDSNWLAVPSLLYPTIPPKSFHTFHFAGKYNKSSI